MSPGPAEPTTSPQEGQGVATVPLLPVQPQKPRARESAVVDGKSDTVASGFEKRDDNVTLTSGQTAGC